MAASNRGMIALLGAPGSGKTTQGDILVARYGAVMFDTGAELRKSQDPVLREWINAGNLAGINEIERLLRDFFGRCTPDQPVVLVGFPRSTEQATLLETVCADLGRAPATLVVIDLDDEAAKERLRRRGRKDDTEDIMVNRFRVFATETYPVIAFAQEQGWTVEHLDGSAKERQVTSQIEAITGWRRQQPERAIT